MRTKALLRSLGQQVRERRAALSLTQDQLGKKAGIVGKYVSEIERGTRDLPVSTLVAVIEQGLGLRLELTIGPRNGNGHGNGNGNGGRHDSRQPPAPSVEEIAKGIAALSPERRHRILAIIRALIELVPQE
jgi:transcriptional regulator with XRE-family HTH domain